MARAVHAPLPIDVLLAIRAAPVADDVRDVRELGAALQRVHVLAELADEFLTAVLDVDQRRRIAGRQERQRAVSLSEPPAVRDCLLARRWRGRAAFDPPGQVPDQACVQGRDRDGVLDPRANVADTQLQRRIADRRADVPADLARVRDGPELTVAADNALEIGVGVDRAGHSRSRQAADDALTVRLQPGELSGVERR